MTFLFIVAGLPALHFFICMDRQQKYLIDICRDLHGTFHSPTSFWQQLLHRKGSFQFIGQFAQRKIVLEYFYRWPNLLSLIPGIAPEERLEIRFPLLQKFWLRMLLERNHPGDGNAIVLNEPDVDSLYIIHSNQPEAAKTFLTGQLPLPNLRLQDGFGRLEIHHGVGTAEIFFPNRRNFQSAHLEVLIEWLARFISEYEVQSTLVVAMALATDTRCPYCRELLNTTSSEKILECVQCSARLHENCWRENKQCTTWGCQSGIASPFTHE